MATRAEAAAQGKVESGRSFDRAISKLLLGATATLLLAAVFLVWVGTLGEGGLGVMGPPEFRRNLQSRH